MNMRTLMWIAAAAAARHRTPFSSADSAAREADELVEEFDKRFHMDGGRKTP